MEILLNHGYCNALSNELEEFIKSLGYSSMWDIKARTDISVIKFVRENLPRVEETENSEQYYGDFNWHMRSIFEIVKVDTSKPWTIDKIDNSEIIKYLNLEDIELNYYTC